MNATRKRDLVWTLIHARCFYTLRLIVRLRQLLIFKNSSALILVLAVARDGASRGIFCTVFLGEIYCLHRQAVDLIKILRVHFGPQHHILIPSSYITRDELALRF